MKSLIWILGSITLYFSANVSAIEIGSMDQDRMGSAYTLNGSTMEFTREKLLNPRNFGPDGTYPESVNITSVSGELTLLELSDFDIFFVGSFADASENTFHALELDAMVDWVTAGGTIILTCDWDAFDLACNRFGLTVTNNEAEAPFEPTLTGATRPPFNGPFGTPSSLNGSQFQSWFSNTGGFAVLAEDQNRNPVILEALIGNGRVVALGDFEIVADDTLSEGPEIENDNDQFLANLVAYLDSEAQETFIINPGINGNWWGGPGRSGEGMQMELVIDGELLVIVATFYSYDDAGNQIFLIAVGPANGSSAAVDVFITEGAMWGPDFDPADVTETQFGTGEISFSHCGLARLSVTPSAQYMSQGFSQVEYDIVRLVTPAGRCPQPNP